MRSCNFSQGLRDLHEPAFWQFPAGFLKQGFEHYRRSEFFHCLHPVCKLQQIRRASCWKWKPLTGQAPGNRYRTIIPSRKSGSGSFMENLQYA